MDIILNLNLNLILKMAKLSKLSLAMKKPKRCPRARKAKVCEGLSALLFKHNIQSVVCKAIDVDDYTEDRFRVDCYHPESRQFLQNCRLPKQDEKMNHILEKRVHGKRFDEPFLLEFSEKDVFGFSSKEDPHEYLVYLKGGDFNFDYDWDEKKEEKEEEEKEASSSQEEKKE